MKVGKVAVYGLVILGLLGCVAYALHIKRSSPSQVAKSGKIVEKKQVDNLKTTPDKETDHSTTTAVSTSGVGANIIPSTSTTGATTTQTTTPKRNTSTASPESTTTTVTHGSWFMIPGDIKWNQKTYHIDAKTRITAPGKEIGTGQDLQVIPDQYPIYEIPGIDPSQAVAIDVHQVYFEAILQK